MGILVTGATGYVGSRLVTALLASGHQVVAASRDPERLKRFGWSGGVTPVALDASDPASVRAAIRRLARALTPPITPPTLRLVNKVSGPPAGALRTGLDVLIALTPKVRRA